jgi:hypothetical protein
LGFPVDLDDADGVLRGISSKSIAQMVCFSFGAWLIIAMSLPNFQRSLQGKIDF